MKLKSILLVFFLAVIAVPQLQAAYTIANGRIVDTANVPEMPLEGHYNAAVQAYQNKNWDEAARNYYIVIEGFPSNAYTQESAFYLAVCYFNQGEYDTANETFSAYLQGKDHPRLFQEAIEYKYAIAEKFRFGARRRFLGQKQLPKWATGGTLALSIYDEVIAALPCHDLAAKALYSKALLLRSRGEFRESIDSLQMAVRRFSKHDLTPECYLLINKVYLDQCRLEFQNPDILAFAEINLKRFQQQFPREERLFEAEADVLAIKEVYGGGLAETGMFYERCRRPNASALYYRSAIKQFPETYAAELSRSRLRAMGMEVPLPNVNPELERSVEAEEAEEAEVEVNEKEASEKIDWVP